MFNRDKDHSASIIYMVIKNFKLLEELIFWISRK